jgi:Tol biopolymer transport system component
MRNPSRRGRKARRLAVEELEARTLPTTLAPLTTFNPFLASSDSAGGAAQALTSADGRFTVYASTAPNVVPGQVDTAVASNVFLYDRQTGTTTLVSHLPGSGTNGADGNCVNPRISGDGRFIAYESDAPNLAAGQTGPRGYFNVFLYDQLTGVNTLVSHRFGDPTTAGDETSETFYTTGFGLGANTGRFLLFTSNADDLVANQQGPDVINLFLYDTTLGTTTLVSRSNTDPNPLQPSIGGNGDAEFADLTPDGSSVVFQSFATDAVPQQTGEPDNIFRYTAATGTIRLVSGVYANGSGNSPTDGAGHSSQPTISADGSTVAYISNAFSLVANQTSAGGQTTYNNVFLYNTSSGRTTLVSGDLGSPSETSNALNNEAVLSADGSTVAFLSAATDLVPGQGSNTGNVFVYSGGKLALASHTLTSTTTAAGGVGINDTDTFDDISLSTDGRLLCYESTAVLASGELDVSGSKQVFLYDTSSGTNTLVSQVNGFPGLAGAPGSNYAHLSADGSTVAFLSLANGLMPGVDNINLVPGVNVADGGQNLFVSQVSLGSGGPVVTGPVLASTSAFPATATTLVYGLSADGNTVLFSTNDASVVPGQADNNHDQDLFLLDRSSGAITLVSHAFDMPTTTGRLGTPALAAGVQSHITPVLSADGNWVAFVSQANNLAANPVTGENGANQVYLFDNRTGPTRGTITLVSHAFGSATTAGGDNSDSPALSNDGRFLAFRSSAPDLVQDFVPSARGVNTPNVFLFDTTTGTLTLVSHAAGAPLQSGDKGSFGPSVSDDLNGTCRVAYASTARNLLPGSPVPPYQNVYLFDSSSPSATTLVSHVLGSATTAPAARSGSPALSHDGTTVAFVSFASDLVAQQSAPPGTPYSNVFLDNVARGAVSLVSGSAGSPSATAGGYSDSPAVNDDGSRVAFRSDAPDLVAGQVVVPGTTSSVFLFLQPSTGQTAPTVLLLSHACDTLGCHPTTTAGGDSSAPAIDGTGNLVVYLSTATDLVPGQQPGSGVNNVYLYSVPLGDNGLVSGQEGSTVVPGSDPTFLPLVSRGTGVPVPPQIVGPAARITPFRAGGSRQVVTFDRGQGRQGASVPYVNVLAQVTVTPDAIADGTAGPVGTLTFDSVYAGQYQPAGYTLAPGVPDDQAFAIGTVRGTSSLYAQGVVNYAVQPSYQLSILVNASFAGGDYPLTVYVQPNFPPPPPPPPPPPRPTVAEVVPVRVGPRKKRRTRLMVEVFYADDGSLKEVLPSRFQPPAFRHIRASIVGTRVVVTARKGRHTVRYSFPG